jgi:2-dehydropantoate 2-reductase
VDAINGVLSEQGRKVGIPTPVNDQVVSLIHRIEAQELQPSMENLNEFKI